MLPVGRCNDIEVLRVRHLIGMHNTRIQLQTVTHIRYAANCHSPPYNKAPNKDAFHGHGAIEHGCPYTKYHLRDEDDTYNYNNIALADRT